MEHEHGTWDMSMFEDADVRNAKCPPYAICTLPLSLSISIVVVLVLVVLVHFCFSLGARGIGAWCYTYNV
jgi:hypothetical protein